MSGMKPNPILSEIRATRDRLAKECGFDVRKLAERIRLREAQEKARGTKFVSFESPESSVLHEEPPKK
jgi:hypothetical protein